MKKVFLILAVAISFGLVFNSCNKFKKSSSQTTTVVATDPCAAQNAQIQNLMTQLADLRAENAKLQADLECCESKLPAAKTSTAKKPATTVKATPKPTPAPAPTQTKSATKPTPRTNTKLTNNAVGATANLDYLRQDGDIIFCAQANNREDAYFPHYAMQHGVLFSKAPKDNQIKGYNWRVEPTEFYDGDYGVTVDGTFYVADNIIQQSLKAGSLAFETPLRIKCPYTTWIARDMTLEDGYWIFRTQRNTQNTK